MRILITGASGFLGAILKKHLDGKHTILSFSQDVRDGVEIPEGIDSVIHLASVYDSNVSTFRESIEINTIGTYNVIKAAIKANVKRFIYFSSVHVYSNLVGEVCEKTITRPYATYALTHKMAEDIVFSEHNKGTIEGVCLRLSNGYGVPELPSKNAWMPIVNNMVDKAITTGKIVLQPSAYQKRDFIATSDVCSAVDHVLTTDHISDGLFNVGGNNVMKISEVAYKVALMVGDVDVVDKTNGINVGFIYNIDKIMRTGWKPTANMDSVILDIIEYRKMNAWGIG